MVTHPWLAILGLCLLLWPNIIYGAVLRPSLSSEPGETKLTRLPFEGDGSTQQGEKPVLKTRQSGQTPPVVYRGDVLFFSPDYYRKRGGIPPVFTGPTTDKSFSLQTHHNRIFYDEDMESPYNYSSAYVTTSSSFSQALYYATSLKDKDLQSDGWVYKIHPTPNMIDLKGPMIGSGAPWIKDVEVAALGGIRWDQIEAYMAIPKTTQSRPEYRYHLERFAKDYPGLTWTKNEDYNAEYDRYSQSGPQPQLVGDWDGNPQSSNMTLEESAIEFMSKTGAPVGWRCTFPLNLTEPVDFSNGEPKSACPAKRANLEP